MSNSLKDIDWVIIGLQTPYSPKTAPKLEWVCEIEESSDRAGIPIFEKNNLAKLLNRPLRQEYPGKEVKDGH